MPPTKAQKIAMTLKPKQLREMPKVKSRLTHKELIAYLTKHLHEDETDDITKQQLIDGVAWRFAKNKEGGAENKEFAEFKAEYDRRKAEVVSGIQALEQKHNQLHRQADDVIRQQLTSLEQEALALQQVDRELEEWKREVLEHIEVGLEGLK